MAAQSQGASNVDLFDAYFRRADLDRDGRISGAEAVGFFQGSNLPKQILAQIWSYADQNREGFLGRAEFYNALKLATVAQSKRELTPDIVKAALYSPASAKIPAPQISFPTTTPIQPNAPAGPTSTPLVGTYPSPPQNPGMRGPTVLPSNVNMTQQYNQPQVNESMTPLSVISPPIHPVGFHGFPGGGSALGPQVTDSKISNDVLGQKTAGTSTGVASQFPVGVSSSSTPQSGFGPGASGPAAFLPPRPPAASGIAQSAPQVVDPKSQVSENGFAANPLFGGSALATNVGETVQDNRVPMPSAGSEPASLVGAHASVTKKAVSHDLVQNSLTTQPAAGQIHTLQPLPRQNQQVSVQITSGTSQPPSGVNLSQLQWKKMTQSDVQKYTKVFVEVDTDKDGKITGLQARNLFMSWGLPREVLKQIWDLSDQDTDGMLSVKEFFIALYLMERYREGRPLPAVLPASIMADFTGSVQPSGYGSGAWGFSPGFQQQQSTSSSNVRQVPRPAGKPPLPVPPSASDDRQAKAQKAKIPVLDKHLVDQLSEEEQKSLVSKFHEATEANKKVEELGKEIKETRERIEFFRAKMQELVLYKSRCDSHLNEIMERAAADRHEVESLAKKYEEKYRQAGHVASKLTIEEATFRDIQERKMELYRAIVKMEQEGDSDESLQLRADRIQVSLEELVKSLSDCCKKYGLLGKPTTLLELPFGWQPGIQEAVADWDEEWDKFEDEGFSLVKELTLDVQNIVAPPKTKLMPAKNEAVSKAEGETNDNPSDNGETPHIVVKPNSGAHQTDGLVENGSANHQTEDTSTRSQPTSPIVGNSHGSPKGEVMNLAGNMTGLDASPRADETQSNSGSSEPSFSGDKSFNDLAWGNFDSNDDVDSIWGFNPVSSTKETSQETDADDDLFGPGKLSLNPIKTGSSHTDAGFRRGSSVFADSVPSTPLYTSNYSPRRYGEGLEEHGFNLSRFDSFQSTDGGFQASETLARFDSMRSTSEFDYSHGFSSFDDSDPFGTGPFKSSFTSETPRRDSDAFGFGAPFRSAFGSETPKTEDNFGHVEPFRSSFANETPRRDSDTFSYGRPSSSSFGAETPRAEDPFGSVGPFRSSLGSETPRSDYGSIGPFRSSLGSEPPGSDYGTVGPFRSSLGNETPRSDYDLFASSGVYRSSFTSETPRRDAEPFRSGGPFKTSFTSETPRAEAHNWSAF